MPQAQPGESGLLNINNLQDTAMNVVNLFCSVICMPVEIILRPTYGTRYFPPAVVFLSAVLMLFLPLLSAASTAVTHMIPFMGAAQPPSGMFDIGSLSKLFFLLSFIHGIRLYRLMIHMEKEKISSYEGPPLPFIPLIPGSQVFFLTRIFIEPVLVFVTATVANSFFIFQDGLTNYLHLAALALAMKQFAHWYRSFQLLRDILDARNTGPLIGKFLDNSATEEELAPIHLASFPKNTPSELRKAAAIHIARAYGEPVSQGENHAAH